MKNHDCTPKNHIFSIAEGGAKIVEVFRVKNHDFTPKKSYFFSILGGRAPGAAPPPPPPPPPESAPGVYISQLICYSRACAQYIDLLDKAQLLTKRLLKHGYVAPRLKFYGRRHNLVDRYEISISQMTMDLLLFT